MDLNEAIEKYVDWDQYNGHDENYCVIGQIALGAGLVPVYPEDEDDMSEIDMSEIDSSGICRAVADFTGCPYETIAAIYIVTDMYPNDPGKVRDFIQFVSKDWIEEF